MYYSFFYIKCISDNNRHMLHTVSAAPLQPPPTSVSLMHNDVSGCCKYKMTLQVLTLQRLRITHTRLHRALAQEAALIIPVVTVLWSGSLTKTLPQKGSAAKNMLQSPSELLLPGEMIYSFDFICKESVVQSASHSCSHVLRSHSWTSWLLLLTRYLTGQTPAHPEVNTCVNTRPTTV